MEKLFKQITQNMSVRANAIPLILVTLLMSFAAGLFIYWVYKKNFRGVMFSHNFSLTLVLMTTITAPVVMCISNSLELSLGMVGALSIVRFRTAVKDPLDTGYMFWALTMGILIGAGQFLLAAIVIVGIAVVVFVLRMLTAKGYDSYLLVMRVNQTGEQNAQKLLAKVHSMALKSKTVTGSGIELTYEIRTDKAEQLVSKLLTLEGISDASLVAYQSETI